MRVNGAGLAVGKIWVERRMTMTIRIRIGNECGFDRVVTGV
jgi:hypothetical protein